MPQEPKKRHSRQRQGKRRASIKLTATKSEKCRNCSNLALSHRVCPSCGFYKGKQVLTIKQKKEKGKEEKK
ncbi:MAG: 50S ribosomal protein L32 [bacterium]|nr:50S ribosomal protein L32 [bacterium]